MQRDIRQTAQAAAVSAFYTALFEPDTGHIHGARGAQALADGTAVLFVGSCFAGTLEDGPSSDLYRLDCDTSACTKIAANVQSFDLSSDQQRIVIARGGTVEIIAATDGKTIEQATLSGLIEAARWSPDGQTLALLVAGARADVAGYQGGYAMRVDADGPSWLPEIDTGDSEDVWRCVWLWQPGAGGPVCLTAPPVNIWECDWLGNDRLVTVASDHHSEGSWYGASLRTVTVANGTVTEVHRGTDQLALPRGSADGQKVAFVEAVCSDRAIVCGTLRLLEESGVHRIDTGTAEISDIAWRGSDALVYSGLDRFDTLVGEVRLSDGCHIEHMRSQKLTCGQWYPAAQPFPGGGALAVIEAYDRAPALAALKEGLPHILNDFAPTAHPECGQIEPMSWQAPDGLEIDGWLIRPKGGGTNLPLLIDIHGGPIWGYRNRWVAAFRAAGPLAAQGYAIFLPNPRGSGGRGQDFARAVVGDMGGADVHDILSGVDALVARGIVDPARVGVTGSSYGGVMSATLITTDDRFAAAIVMSPVANWYSQHFTSQIPSFDEAFVQGSPRTSGGQYFDRSPAFFAGRVKTPTLTIVGARDKNTPPTQGLEFHHALLEAGCTSALCAYPEDGHSLRGYPAYLDTAARIMIWLDWHLGKGVK